MAAGDWMNYSRSFNLQWERGDALLYIAVSYKSTADEPADFGAGDVALFIEDWCRPLTAQPQMAFNRSIHRSGVHRQPLHELACPACIERTPAWTAVQAGLASCGPHLPAEGLDFIRRWVWFQVNRAARATLGFGTQRRSTMTAVVVVRATTYRELPQDHEVMAAEAMRRGLMVNVFMVSGERCSICLGEVRKWALAGWMPCCHFFHRNCIAEWLWENATCPVCRLRLPPFRA